MAAVVAAAWVLMVAGMAGAQEETRVTYSYPVPPDEENWEGQFQDPEHTKLLDGRPGGGARYSVIWAATTEERFVDVDLGEPMRLDRVAVRSYKHYTGRDFQLDHVRLYLTDDGPEGPWRLLGEQAGYALADEKGIREFAFEMPDEPLQWFRVGVQNDDAVRLALSEIDIFSAAAPDLSYVLAANFDEVFHEPEGPPPTPTADQQQRGYILFAPHWMRKVFGNSVPLDGEGAALAAAAAPGEYEPMTLAVYPLRDLGECTPTVGELAGPDGATLGPETIEVRTVRLWAQIPGQKGASYANQYIETPELLEAGPTIEVEAGRTREWWLTAHVQEDARPGTYVGAASLTPGDGAAIEVTLTVEVRPVTLREPEGFSFGMYWAPWRESADTPDEQVVAQLRDMRAHGMNSAALAADASMARDADGQWSSDLTALIRALELMRAEGLTGPVPWGYAFPPVETEFGSEEHFAQVQAFVEHVQGELAERGLGEVLWYPRDEPWSGERREQCRVLLEAIKRVAGARTYVTTRLDTAREFDPWLDVRCHTLSLSGGFDPVVVRDEAAASGDTYWWYTNACREYPGVMRFKGGCFFWKSGATGQFYWAYQYPSNDPTSDLDGIDWCAAYPGEDGPIPTIEWEGLREGIDDLRYLHTLELEIADARAGGDAAAVAVADEGEALLDEIRDATVVDLAEYEERGISFHTDSIWEPAQYDEYRGRVADVIGRLQGGR